MTVIQDMNQTDIYLLIILCIIFITQIIQLIITYGVYLKSLVNEEINPPIYRV